MKCVEFDLFSSLKIPLEDWGHSELIENEKTKRSQPNLVITAKIGGKQLIDPVAYKWINVCRKSNSIKDFRQKFILDASSHCLQAKT